MLVSEAEIRELRRGDKLTRIMASPKLAVAFRDLLAATARDAPTPVNYWAFSLRTTGEPMPLGPTVGKGWAPLLGYHVAGRRTAHVYVEEASVAPNLLQVRAGLSGVFALIADPRVLEMGGQNCLKVVHPVPNLQRPPYPREGVRFGRLFPLNIHAR